MIPVASHSAMTRTLSIENSTRRPNTDALDKRRKLALAPRLGEVLFTPGNVGYIPPIAVPIVPVAIAPIPPKRGINITADCRAMQSVVGWKLIPRTQNNCPPPALYNACGTAAPSCQFLEPSTACGGVISCYTPCASLFPLTGCTSVLYPTSINLGPCSGGSVVCGPTSQSSSNCNPLAYMPTCNDGSCSEMTPPSTDVIASARVSGKNVALSVLPSYLTPAANVYSDPNIDIQWIKSTQCDSSVPTIIRYNQV
jgi:hypothetical protein